MERTREPLTRGTELVAEHGKTNIADTVIAKIAAVAAKEIEGVHDLLTQGMGEAITGLAQRVTRGETRGQGVRVETEDGTATVHLRITVDYGVSIIQIADALRRNIIDNIKAMAGMEVKEVNIDVADLYFPESSEFEQERRTA